jgi:hypothetical protein
LLVAVIVQAKPTTPEYAITDIKVYLYLSNEDALKDISNVATGSLRNTPAGAGVAGTPSDSTLVVVEVTGDRHAYEPARRVELVVKEIGRKTVTKLQKSLKIGLLEKEGKYFAAFWLYDTGCVPLEITARLVGQRTDHRTTKRVEFACGE